MMSTHKNKLKEGGLIDLDEVLLPAVDLVGAGLVDVLLVLELAVLDNLCKDASVYLAHGNFHSVDLVDVLEHSLDKVNLHGDGFFDLKGLAVLALELEGDVCLLGVGVCHGGGLGGVRRRRL